MLLSSKIFVFCFGFVVGFYLFLLICVQTKSSVPLEQKSELKLDREFDATTAHYENWLRKNNIKIQKANLDDLAYSKDRQIIENKLESQLLFDLVDVACLVSVESMKNAYLIDNTWGHKCNSLSFYSSKNDSFIKTNVIPHAHKWQFLCDSLRHLWINNKKLQWVLYSPDDVYVKPENLRYYVASKDYNQPHYFGHKVVFWKQLYNSDKTSFVLSRGAIEALISKFNTSSACINGKEYINDAAYTLGKHLSRLNIHAEDTRDHKNRDRFHIFTFEQLMSEENPETITRNSKTSFYPVKQGKECCSDSSISFRSVQNDRTYFYKYLLYHVKIFLTGNAANKHDCDSDNEVWKEFIRNELGENTNLSTISNDMYFRLWKSKILDPEEFNRMIREEVINMNVLTTNKPL